SAEEVQAQAYWATHPEAQSEWEEDSALTRQLHDLPGTPLSSNFTSLVLRAIAAEAREVQQPSAGLVGSWWSRWLTRSAPRMALGLLVVGLGFSLFFQHQSQGRRQLAKDVREFVYVAALPGPEVFEDFDAIQKLQPVSFSKDDD